MLFMNTVCPTVIEAPCSNTWVLPWVRNPTYICLAAQWVSNWILGMSFTTTTCGQVDMWRVIILATIWRIMFTAPRQSSLTSFNPCGHAATSTKHYHTLLIILEIILLHIVNGLQTHVQRETANCIKYDTRVANMTKYNVKSSVTNIK